MRGPAAFAAAIPLTRRPRAGVSRGRAAARAAPACCAVSAFSKGDRVRVAASPLVLWHVAGRMGEETDVAGFEGEVVDIVDKVNDQPITATKPVVVKMKMDTKNFRAHFEDAELEKA